ncbi:fused MFS/spermidine synthase [Archangium sp.]|uniref:spermidine synthase n=1 Tax=Archangium sp. TaxID=1872627 RepID=UPI002D69778F|nr:fused MFS/spermidine synthase [Archangium sp.]HYO52617.1 fused MFS/spermidine synthase [Archangium sp.]
MSLSETVVHEADSPYGPVYVVDVGDQRTLRFDSPEGTLQSAILKSDPLAVPTSYVRVATAGLALTRGRSRVLVVGLGGGAFPMLLHRLLPRRSRVDVVELNPVVVDVARRFFGVREDPRLHIHVGDGARFMAREGARYDLILLDAFSDSGTPDHLKEALFLEDVRRRLEPGGVAVLNIALEKPRDVTPRIETFARAFEDCAMLRGASQYNNLILVGTLEPLPSEPLFRQQLWRLARELEFPALTESVVSFERARTRR